MAQKFTAGEVIKANSAAEERELKRLREQVAEYERCLQEMRRIQMTNTQTAQNLHDLMVESTDSIRRFAKESADTFRELTTQSKDELEKLAAQSTAKIADIRLETEVQNAEAKKSVETAAYTMEQMEAKVVRMQETVAEVTEVLNSNQKEIEEWFKQADDFLHKENVKVYRNVQAVVVEEVGNKAEDIIKAQIKVQDYDNGCPAELREKYNKIAEAALADIADREVRELCGDISTLSAKKSSDLIRKLDNMPLDPEAKTKYIDALDNHIADLKSEEVKGYIKYLSDKMSEFGINVVHLCVPGMSNLFDAKYSSACSTYVSTGRYELPILVHEGNAGEGFTMTTEYLYIGDRGEKVKIKIDDIASFQAKKSLMSSILTSVERNGNTNEIPNALNKNVVENVAKVLTALVSFVHDQRSAEHMKEMLANAVQEKAMQPTVSAPVTETPVADEVKVNFCDQCGAKITNTNAKFCAECGNKLM